MAKLKKIKIMSQSTFEDLSNTSDNELNFVAGVAVAGTKKETIPIVSGTMYNYTAPADGYVVIAAITNQNAAIYIYNTTVHTGWENTAVSANRFFRMTLRVAKGDVIHLGFTGALTEAFFAYDK